MSAVNLDSLAPIISARGGRIVGIAPGPEAADDFIVETRWKHDLLIDEKRNVYKALNLKNNGIKECYGFCICCNSVGSWYKKASKAGFKNDLRGNKSQYGGTLLVQGGREGRVICGHRQTKDDFEPNMDVLLDGLHATDEERRQRHPYQGRDDMK
jgi:hypothetical protein